MLILVVMIAALVYDKILGIRVVGLAEIGYGIYCIHTRNIPSGWRSMPPGGYLTGRAAIVAGAIDAREDVSLIRLPSPQRAT